MQKYKGEENEGKRLGGGSKQRGVREHEESETHNL